MVVRVLFMGRKQVAADALEWLMMRNDVEIVGVLTDDHLSISPTTEVALKYGLEVFDFETTLSRLKAGTLQFDLGVSMLFWRKFRDEYISVPKLGIINFHPAPLPEYKGTAGYNLAILEGRSDWACSAHYVDEEIDTGEIIKVSWFDIDSESETAQSLERKSTNQLLDLYTEIVTNVLVRREKLETSPNLGGKYTSRADMEAMKKVVEGDDLERKVRAFWFPPYDGAYIEIDEERYTLVSRRLLEILAPVGSSSLFSSPSKK
ncbi:formyltransferase family protein [Pseudidiomarina aestuarii]|uniref:formyltransferase family protein n=1 Tax=Pseudidiomarina aestuarii TaxID=624146 RepID=UPI003A97C63E